MAAREETIPGSTTTSPSGDSINETVDAVRFPTYPDVRT